GLTGEANDTHLDLANAVLNYDFDWAQMTSVASWLKGGAALAQDLSQYFVAPLSTNNTNHNRSFSAEARIASRKLGRIQFLAGLYYENQKTDGIQTFDWPGANNPYVTTPAFLAVGAGETRQRAAFGEVSYDVTGKISVTLGGRYFKYDV